MDRCTIVNTAVIISCLTMAPFNIPKLDNLAQEGMSASAIVAVQIAAHSVNPLQTLAFLFAFVTILLDPVKARVQEATLVGAILCFLLSTMLLGFVRICPLSLFSVLSLAKGLNLCLTLVFFFSWLREIVRPRP